MDLLKNLTGGSESKKPAEKPGLLDRLHGAVGGGPQSEHKEDALDKGTITPDRPPSIPRENL
jgi:hypothetical protein